MSMNPLTPPGIANTGQVAAPSVTRDRNLSISEIILQLGLKSMELSEKKMNEFYDKIEANNYRLTKINEAKEALEKSGTGPDKTNMSFIDPKTGKEVEGTVTDFMEKYGYGKPDTIADAKGKLNNASDSLGSVNSMDMTKLQSAINKMNEMTQLVSNNISKFNQMNMAIIGNLR